MRLVEDLGLQDILGHRWEDTVHNDLLFAKVCEGIYGHDYLLAEVTEPNANVLLEIGYALAAGRLPILLKDKNRTPWPRELLTTLESCFYETRADVLQHVLAVQADRHDLPESPNRRLPFLQKMGIFEHTEEPGTVCHLKPKISSDWISAVEKQLKESYFRFSGTDPTDSAYDEFFPQARAIQRASLIVASLLGTNIEAYQQHNANVALLIGFAIGLGKEVLVLTAGAQSVHTGLRQHVAAIQDRGPSGWHSRNLAAASNQISDQPKNRISPKGDRPRPYRPYTRSISGPPRRTSRHVFAGLFRANPGVPRRHLWPTHDIHRKARVREKR